VPWSEEEHRLFLQGLEIYGKGDWRSISRKCVLTRNPTQVLVARIFVEGLWAWSGGLQHSRNCVLHCQHTHQRGGWDTYVRAWVTSMDG